MEGDREGLEPLARCVAAPPKEPCRRRRGRRARLHVRRSDRPPRALAPAWSERAPPRSAIHTRGAGSSHWERARHRWHTGSAPIRSVAISSRGSPTAVASRSRSASSTTAMKASRRRCLLGRDRRLFRRRGSTRSRCAFRSICSTRCRSSPDFRHPREASSSRTNKSTLLPRSSRRSSASSSKHPERSRATTRSSRSFRGLRRARCDLVADDGAHRPRADHLASRRSPSSKRRAIPDRRLAHAHLVSASPPERARPHHRLHDADHPRGDDDRSVPLSSSGSGRKSRCRAGDSSPQTAPKR